MAWSVTKNIVLRGAYGISYYPTGAQGGGNAKPPATGFIANPTFFSQDQGLTSGFNWDNGFPQNYQRPPFIDPGFGVVPGTAPGTTTWLSERQAAAIYAELQLRHSVAASVQLALGRGLGRSEVHPTRYRRLQRESGRSDLSQAMATCSPSR